jgi:hypothetical protein
MQTVSAILGEFSGVMTMARYLSFWACQFGLFLALTIKGHKSIF